MSKFFRTYKGMTLLKKPLTLKALKLHAKNGRLIVNVPFILDDLVYLKGGLNGFNDMADERVLEEGCLSDISYAIVGSIPKKAQDDRMSGYAIIQINASVSDLFGD